MSARLPIHIDPIRFADTRRSIAGRMSLSAMERLSASLSQTDSEVDIELDFGSDERGLRVINLSIQGSLRLVCQRCMKMMDWPLSISSTMGLVKFEKQIERLPEHYEPLMVDSQPMLLTAIIEDEILLSLPVVASHPQGQCSLKHAEDDQVSQKEGNQQFAVLAQLRDQLKKK